MDSAVVGQARWLRNGLRYPLWADDPADLNARDLIPIRLLRPDIGSAEVVEWCKAATDDPNAVLELAGEIAAIGKAIATYNIPYLSLPAGTAKEVALDVFIKLNTSSVKLTPYDIVVAQIEEARGASLHELVDELDAAVPGLRRYRAVTDFILDVAALREDRPPTRSSYFKLDLNFLADGWQELVDGLRFTVETLEAEKVFDGDRLPTVAVLSVLAALHADLPETLDAAGNARSLVRAYLWRAFTTARYEASASTRALQDLRGLRSEIRGSQRSAPIFDDTLHPTPTSDEIGRAGWPKNKEVLARGVLAASLRAGAKDLADRSSVTAEHLPRREYHHLFPEALLTGPGRLDTGESYRAVNCALITWRTNRSISAKEPIAYLKERVDRTALGEDEIRRRAATHLIPYDLLASAGGYRDLSVDSAAHQISRDYEAFCDARARMIATYVAALARGEEPREPS